MASCLGELKQVQEKRFDSHLAGVSKWKFYLAHENNSTLQNISIECAIKMQMSNVE